MNKLEFQEYIKQEIRYLDGATGSNLIKSGMPTGVCPEQWILEHRDVCLNLQKQYVAAGTDILYCPTFSGNRVKLSEYHLEEHMEELITQLVGISKEAAASTDRRVLIAGDLTMTGRQLIPMGTMELEELITIYKEQICYLEKAGVDLLVVETMMSLQEARAALIAAKEVSALPVMVTMTFEKDGRTLFGTDALTAAIVLEKLGAAAIGANCSTGPAKMRDIIRTMAQSVSIPVIAKPNAGLPYTDDQGNTCYSMDAEQFSEEMVLLIEAGASILGGCCGTTPEYIRLLKSAAQNRNPFTPVKSPVRYLTSEQMTVSFSLDQSFLIVGERINPTGKKAFQASLREGSLDMVRRFAEEQEACGAQILDVNMGMSGINEKEMMIQAIREVSSVTNLPLSLDSSHVEVLEEALRQYPGRALINSISLETEKFEKLLPLAAKYGAMFILLPLSDKGLPENLEEKKEIIQKIVNRALELGLTKEDIIVDGLVTTIGANKKAALETLETIRYCKELGLATICGLSNISFGMPERSYINTAFLTLAISAGLTMAIANPSQELLVSCALATDLLLNKEEADIRYIEYISAMKEKQAPHILQEQHSASPQSEDVCQLLHKAVVKGDRKGIIALTQKAIDQGEDPSKLLNQGLLPAINLVGEYFDKGTYFLPQLIASAETMKNAISILEPLLLKETDTSNMPVVVMATVEGDIHDIGKNLVTLMLKNYGFKVIDLGKDVPAERIIQTAREYNAAIIGLSALMTTTMQRMGEVLALVKQEELSCKVMIGGAVITKEYAEEIGADGYAGDAAEAVKVAMKLVQTK
ncbi:MAG: homocysteine S-methyltransferase family protein [Lachnospiraceae bacterium]|nr:homocysteine S-methyltransferase family protein [Lachnospiraceae bacterium]